MKRKRHTHTEAHNSIPLRNKPVTVSTFIRTDTEKDKERERKLSLCVTLPKTGKEKGGAEGGEASTLTLYNDFEGIKK